MRKKKKFTTKNIILGTVSDNLRMVAAIGKSDISNINLEEADKNMHFNGDHSDAKGLTNEDMLSVLDKMMAAGEF